MTNFIIIPLTLLMLLVPLQCDIYTSHAHVAKLLQTEAEIMKMLRKYLELETQRLEKVKRIHDQFLNLYLQVKEDSQKFLSNPINTFRLIKYLVSDWSKILTLIREPENKVLIENLAREDSNLIFPQEIDLQGAAAGLLRLQETYELDTSLVARGAINGLQISPELTGNECYEMGLQAFAIGDSKHSLQWMQEALHRTGQDSNQTDKRISMLEHAIYAAYQEKKDELATQLSIELLELDPDYHQPKTISLKAIDTAEGSYHSHTQFKKSGISFTESYNRLCRGEALDDKEHSDDLRCRYFTNDDPYLFLQPVKEEEMLLNPRILLYHDIISDKEMDIVKTLALPKLSYAISKGEKNPTRYRVNKSAWLSSRSHPAVKRVTHRFEAITGLNAESAEDLHIANYGIGGQYEPHHDHLKDEVVEGFFGPGKGNRLATWLIYLSDVIAGGATVFTDLEVHVKPEKGSAVFWHNLLKSGTGDVRTRHAGCPVLTGSKWISNLWFHERGHEFKRKCTLNKLE